MPTSEIFPRPEFKEASGLVNPREVSSRSWEKTMDDSQIVSDFGVCQKSAKSENGREPYELHEVVNSLRRFDIKMVGAWGFEPQTPTVSR